MKYYTLEYDMNRPSVKQLNVPTDSDYGVAVKVYRNGELVDGDISVGGLSATEGSGDWQLVKLESGSTATTEKLDVDFHKASTLEGDFTGEVSAKNTRSQPQQKAFTLPLSDFLDKDLTITPRDINLELLQKRTAGVNEEYGDFADTSTQYAKVNSLLTFTGTPYSTNLYCSLVNTNDGADGKFTLLVQQDDKGYIEVKKEEPVEDEPEISDPPEPLVPDEPAPDNDGE